VRGVWLTSRSVAAVYNRKLHRLFAIVQYAANQQRDFSLQLCARFTAGAIPLTRVRVGHRPRACEAKEIRSKLLKLLDSETGKQAKTGGRKRIDNDLRH
jgi:hypothetical protein